VLCRGIGWARRRERAEHFHAPAAARTGVEAAVPGLPGVVTVVGRYASRDGDQLAAKGEFLGTMTIAEKTVMAPFRPSSSNIYTPNWPILFIGYEHGIAAQLVRERNAGLVSNHPEQIRDQSQTWIEDKQTGRFKRLDPFVSRGLSRDEQYQKLERLFAEILCHSGPLASHPAAG
jgi:hypothetical protein